MSGDDKLWSKRDVAEYLAVDVRTVERLAIPRVTITGTGRQRPMVRYYPDQVKAWVDARASRPKTRRAG